MLAPFPLAVALIAVAGWVDAVGFLQLGNLFVSFMSGNSTQMSVALGQGQWTAAAQAGAVILLFVLGVLAGSLVAMAAGAKRLPAVLLLEAAVLASAMLFTPTQPGKFSLAALPMALAMGMQNAAISRIGDRTVSLTYVTGTLVRFARELAEAIVGRGERWACLDDLVFWLAMVVGAIVGASGYMRYGLQTLVVPIAAVLALGIASIKRSAAS